MRLLLSSLGMLLVVFMFAGCTDYACFSAKLSGYNGSGCTRTAQAPMERNRQ